MVDQARARRMAGRIKQIVATGIETQIKDPRLGMVTIIDVRLTGDLHDATIFYTVLGDETARIESAAALESARVSCAARSGAKPGSASPRRWRSSSTPSPRPRSTSKSCCRCRGGRCRGRGGPTGRRPGR